MSHEEALHILERYAGTQFDPLIVTQFVGLSGVIQIGRPRVPAGPTEMESIQKLAQAVNDGRAPILSETRKGEDS